ncbi:hypothetical protein HQ590_02385 [bacterium]|nr:hypothetical protein [bacterium]
MGCCVRRERCRDEGLVANELLAFPGNIPRMTSVSMVRYVCDLTRHAVGGDRRRGVPPHRRAEKARPHELYAMDVPCSHGSHPRKHPIAHAPLLAAPDGPSADRGEVADGRSVSSRGLRVAFTNGVGYGKRGVRVFNYGQGVAGSPRASHLPPETPRCGTIVIE